MVPLGARRSVRPVSAAALRLRSAVRRRARRYEDEPADARVEEEERVHGERAPVGRHELAHKAERGGGGPEEAHGDHGEPPYQRPSNEADDGGDVEREDAVAEHADGLEEGDVPAEQQRVDRHHRRAAAHNHKDGRKHERFLLVRSKPGEQRREREAQHERAPEVPVLERLHVGLARVEHAKHLVAHHPQVPHDGFGDGLVERAEVGAHPRHRAAAAAHRAPGEVCHPRTTLARARRLARVVRGWQ
eukprot:CAMPEP_0202737036 /NCGR_PEP_ID=MMETSP1388-20130828/1358_1 /ASSEMBLY_ACC=CAM_ASM_000864 /TAXON_ID=37098 /ORGANISM="Isochrysis sp, Strain CCMP1244" /LENGTH=245 /DNA_ID=CAMNT_0049403575 /DNA_START=81 /DNA_END=816 /DNA_ORIENTATION=+